ncbi:hypothetical protein BN1044_03792, partial [Hafnia alvei]
RLQDAQVEFGILGGRNFTPHLSYKGD